MSEAAFRQRYLHLKRLVDQRVALLAGTWKARDLAEGCRYVLHAGGKRVRSTLLLLSCEAVGGSVKRGLSAGAAVEAMHNFTLVHDDVMDNAPSRRGKPTVHTQWDVNTAILVGDVLIGQAYQSLIGPKAPHVQKIVGVFTKGLLEVCEGQALDLQFERQPKVSLRDYFTMIEKKTARLISMSTEIGADVGGGTSLQVRTLRMFGHYLGRAFQLQDDLLDVVADKKDFGKTVGGDIIEGKKTFLLIHAHQESRGNDRKFLERIMKRRHNRKAPGLVSEVTAIYEKYGVLDAARDQIGKETRKATAMLSHLPRNKATGMLAWFSDILLNRIA